MMKRMVKCYGLIATLLFLAFMTTACDTVTDYNIIQGHKTDCQVGGWFANPFSTAPACTYPYYESATHDDGTTSYMKCGVLRVSCQAIVPTTVTTPTMQCKPEYAYASLTDEGQSWVVVSQQQDQNNSTSSAQVTFTSTTSKTVTVTDKLDVIANLNVTAAGDAGILVGVITVNVKAEIDHEVTQTVNATIGNSYGFSVPPRETAYANYGVRVQITSGHLYDKSRCEGQKSDWGTDITYVPIASGWCVWLSNQPACPSL
jgi:hypothetical protein